MTMFGYGYLGIFAIAGYWAGIIFFLYMIAQIAASLKRIANHLDNIDAKKDS